MNRGRYTIMINRKWRILKPHRPKVHQA